MGLKEILYRRDGQVTGSHTFIGNVALADAHALENPFVGGIDHFLKVGIGKNSWRNIGAKRCNFGASRRSQSRAPDEGETLYFEGLRPECLTRIVNLSIFGPHQNV